MGSSSTTTPARSASARAISSSCWAPTPRSPAGIARSSSASPSTSASRVRAVAWRRAASTIPNRLGSRPEHQVLGDRHLGHERELLVDDRDAGAPRVQRRPERGDLAIDDDLAVERPDRVDAAEDLDQRRLAGAVLADEPDDLAGATGGRADRERHVVERPHARERLADLAQLDHRFSPRRRRNTKPKAITIRIPEPDAPGPPWHAHATPVRSSPTPPVPGPVPGPASG